VVTGTDESTIKQHTAHTEKTEDWDHHNNEPLRGVIHAGSATDGWNKLN